MKLRYSIESLFDDHDLLSLRPLFEELTVDPYLKAGFRRKSIMRVRIENGSVRKQAHEPLQILSSKNFTAPGGKIIRDYPEIPEHHLNPALCKAILTYADRCKIDPRCEILVQAHRITSIGQQESLPVTEGPHQDGMDYLGILCVSRHNIGGGVSQILADTTSVLFEKTLSPGEFLLVNDEAYFHHATPTYCIDLQRQGYRDILIFSTPTARPSELVEVEAAAAGLQ
ncbi:2OG-Fe dioxygenase family protein [Azohydromonas lata]|uniref:2OG-Fe dioxygenase family protein n=1 Tax=Azohydromonas lata TaxID=45677 RepID=A0ABU5ICP8_9BURK|nr:2OG-Fe dioxygenase family protein [Azohydromonas lata]MDZ5456895.1 2OG-Fe dioxygenase family protein [Azohydromonas lata]